VIILRVIILIRDKIRCDNINDDIKDKINDNSDDGITGNVSDDIILLHHTVLRNSYGKDNVKGGVS